MSIVTNAPSTPRVCRKAGCGFRKDSYDCQRAHQPVWRKQTTGQSDARQSAAVRFYDPNIADVIVRADARLRQQRGY